VPDTTAIFRSSCCRVGGGEGDDAVLDDVHVERRGEAALLHVHGLRARGDADERVVAFAVGLRLDARAVGQHDPHGRVGEPRRAVGGADAALDVAGALGRRRRGRQRAALDGRELGDGAGLHVDHLLDVELVFDLLDLDDVRARGDAVEQEAAVVFGARDDHGAVGRVHEDVRAVDPRALVLIADAAGDRARRRRRRRPAHLVGELHLRVGDDDDVVRPRFTRARDGELDLAGRDVLDEEGAGAIAGRLVLVAELVDDGDLRAGHALAVVFSADHAGDGARQDVDVVVADARVERDASEERAESDVGNRTLHWTTPLET
jgi:hypothetical protein